MQTNQQIDRALLGFEKKDNSFIEIIVRLSAAEADVTENAMQSKTRKREVVQARQIAMTLSKYMTKASLQEIGNIIGQKDHATVLHAIKTIHNLIDTDKWVRTMVMRVINTLLTYEETNQGLVCQICGGTRILEKAWVNPNTLKAMELIVENQQPTDRFCEDCNCHVKFVSPKMFNSYDARYQLETVPDRM